ncbi:MAG: NUDIX domain-containing protein [Patescibacteria group bacterium]|nr:NUDIX domain-containing protein [Patescibacteria group bacterium]
MNSHRHLDEVGKTNIASECLVIKDEKVLMFKRSETAKKFPGYWIGPGGHIDENEDPMLAAIREIKEEAGVEVGMDSIKLKAIATHYHIDLNETWVSFIFLATLPTHQKVSEENEEGKAKWIPLKELLEMENVFPPSKYYFDHVLNDKPGIMYANIRWQNAQLVEVLSQRVDING